MTTPWTLQDLAQLVTQYRYSIGTETEFQDGLARVLTMHEIEHAREHHLGEEFGRIDFYIPDRAIGIELKVKTSPSDLLRQLHRYALCPDIKALMLMTVRSRLTLIPDEINSKPLVTACVWQGQF